jgi:tRNA splicing ligase
MNAKPNVNELRKGVPQPWEHLPSAKSSNKCAGKTFEFKTMIRKDVTSNSCAIKNPMRI